MTYSAMELLPNNAPSPFHNHTMTEACGGDEQGMREAEEGFDRQARIAPVAPAVVLQPTDDDILWGCGPHIRNHAGNRRFCETLFRYIRAPNTDAKLRVVQSLYYCRFRNCRFLRRCSGGGGWCEVPERLRRWKIHQWLTGYGYRRAWGRLRNLQLDFVAATNAADGMLPYLLVKCPTEDLFYECLSMRVDIVVRGQKARTDEQESDQEE